MSSYGLQDTSINHFFLSSSGWTSKQFKWNLERYCKILGPTAKCITMLECTRSTPGNVYLCFIANAVALHEVLTEGDLDLSVADVEYIQMSFNKQYKALINGNPHNIYFTSFVPDPCEMFQLAWSLISDRILRFLAGKNCQGLEPFDD
jgi:hypothetical protein